MTIWVDADACPKPIKEILFRAAKRTGVETILVANRDLYIPNSRNISKIIVSKGFDVADQTIAEGVAPGDLVITADIPLAALVIEAGAVVVTPHGDELVEENIHERLSLRDFFQDLRDTGVQTGGPRPFSDQNKRAFASTFDRMLTQLINEQGL